MRSRSQQAADRTEPERDTDVLAKRALAQVIDWVVISLWSVLLVVLVYVADAAVVPLPRALFLLPSVATAALLYNVTYEARSGQTVGKRYMDIVVRDKAGGEPTTKQVVIRNLPALLSEFLILYLAALIMIVSDERNRRTFDLLAETKVTRAG